MPAHWNIRFDHSSSTHSSRFWKNFMLKPENRVEMSGVGSSVSQSGWTMLAVEFRSTSLSSCLRFSAARACVELDYWNKSKRSEITGMSELVHGLRLLKFAGDKQLYLQSRHPLNRTRPADGEHIPHQHQNSLFTAATYRFTHPF